MLNKRALEHLIKAGAFDALHQNRAQLFAGIDAIMAYGAAFQREAESNQVSLFADSAQPMIREPQLPACDDWSRLEKLEHENAAIGFYLSSHPLAGYKNALARLHVMSSAQLAEKLITAYRPVKLAGIVTGKKTKVSDKGRFCFLSMSDLDGAFEVSIFNETLLIGARDHLENGRLLLISADGKSDEGGVRLIAQGIVPLDEAVAKMQAKSAMQVTLVVSDMAAIAPIRNMLVAASGPGATVQLALKAGATETTIELPGKYQHSPEILDRLRSVKGIVSAEEFAA